MKVKQILSAIKEKFSSIKEKLSAMIKEKLPAIKKNLPMIIMSVLLLIAIIVILILGFGNRHENTPVPDEPPTVIGGGEPIPEEQKKPKDAGNIHLPAFAGMTFKAGTKTQNVVLYNPGENTCLIRISLILADGTKIYQSEFVEPGFRTQPITLVAPMERGIYRDVTLQYECFTNDENRSPLNGATSKLDITVQ